MGDAATTYSGSIENLVNGDRVLPRLLTDIAQARRNIHVSMFLFFNDPIGREVAAALIAKAGGAAHPVKVRVMMNIEKTHFADPLHTGEVKMIEADPSCRLDPIDINSLARWMREGGVEFTDDDIDYNRAIATHNQAYDRDESAIRAAVLLNTAHIDHRKIVIIDGHIGYCGSANIGCQYLYHLPFNPVVPADAEAQKGIDAQTPEPWRKWHDGLVRFEGPVVQGFEDAFHERWALNGGDDYPVLSALPGGALTGRVVESMEIVASQPSNDVNPVRSLFKRMIETARSSIFIENPYMYHPDIVEALIAAKQNDPALRIDLVLTTKALNDSGFSADAQEFRYQRYVPVGINVYEYRNHFNHLKLATFDDRYSIVGSANLNYRSLDDERDFELVVLVDDAGFARQINSDVRDLDIAHGRKIAPADLGFFINNRDPLTILMEELREI